MKLGLVHLVREANGEAPFVRFLESYRGHEAGAEHELVLLLKGFSKRAAVERYAALADGANWLVVPDEGYDIGAYLAAARALEHDRLCFLNSYSVIEADGWLARLDGPLARGEAGLAGASGSWSSHLSHLQYYLGLGGPYAGLGDHRRVKALLRSFSFSESAREPDGSAQTSALEALRRLTFEPFPARHVRSNAFCLRRETLLQARVGRQRDKVDAYRFESGRRSLTHEVERLGLRAVVTGRDGVLYDPEEWDRSGTFWQGEQENLLVSDNQTRAYGRAGADVRTALSGLAWGPRP